MTTNFLTKLQWRRALKTFSAGSVNIDPILQAVTLAPSSYGLQPYHVHVVSDVETKQKLRAVSFDQQQVMILLFAYLKH